MKRFFSILLTLAMVLSSMTGVVMAAETTGTFEDSWSANNKDTTGWTINTVGTSVVHFDNNGIGFDSSSTWGIGNLFYTDRMFGGSYTFTGKFRTAYNDSGVNSYLYFNATGTEENTNGYRVRFYDKKTNETGSYVQLQKYVDAAWTDIGDKIEVVHTGSYTIPFEIKVAEAADGALTITFTVTEAVAEFGNEAAVSISYTDSTPVSRVGYIGMLIPTSGNARGRKINNVNVSYTYDDAAAMTVTSEDNTTFTATSVTNLIESTIDVKLYNSEGTEVEGASATNVVYNDNVATFGISGLTSNTSYTAKINAFDVYGTPVSAEYSFTTGAILTTGTYSRNWGANDTDTTGWTVDNSLSENFSAIGTRGIGCGWYGQGAAFYTVRKFTDYTFTGTFMSQYSTDTSRYAYVYFNANEASYEAKGYRLEIASATNVVTLQKYTSDGWVNIGDTQTITYTSQVCDFTVTTKKASDGQLTITWNFGDNTAITYTDTKPVTYLGYIGIVAKHNLNGYGYASRNVYINNINVTYTYDASSENGAVITAPSSIKDGEEFTVTAPADFADTDISNAVTLTDADGEAEVTVSGEVSGNTSTFSFTGLKSSTEYTLTFNAFDIYGTPVSATTTFTTGDFKPVGVITQAWAKNGTLDTEKWTVTDGCAISTANDTAYGLGFGWYKSGSAYYTERAFGTDYTISGLYMQNLGKTDKRAVYLDFNNVTADSASAGYRIAITPYVNVKLQKKSLDSSAYIDCAEASFTETEASATDAIRCNFEIKYTTDADGKANISFTLTPNSEAGNVMNTEGVSISYVDEAPIEAGYFGVYGTALRYAYFNNLTFTYSYDDKAEKVTQFTSDYRPGNVAFTYGLPTSAYVPSIEKTAKLVYDGADVKKAINITQDEDNTLTMAVDGKLLSNTAYSFSAKGYDKYGTILIDNATDFTTAASDSVYINSGTYSVADNTVAFNVSFGNTSGEATSTWVAVAAYDEYNQLIGLYTDTHSVSDGDSISNSFGVSGAAAKVRAFAWDGKDTMNPYCEDKALTVQ